MIQRIQTLYLFFAIIIVFAMNFLPLAELLVDDQVYIFKHYGLKSASGELTVAAHPLAILLTIIPLISLVTIFLFKRRLIQIRLGVLNLLLLLGTYAMIAFYLYFTVGDLDPIIHYSISMVFPLIAIVLTILANKAIRKDERLVKSIDRIR